MTKSGVTPAHSELNNHTDFSYPFVSVIMATRNEQRTINKCIQAFLSQTYPRNRFELSIADRSEDGTRGILEKISTDQPGWLRLIHNPSGRTADGLNLSLQASRGEILIPFGGHAFPKSDFIARIVEKLTNSNIDLVGGRVIPEALIRKPAALAIALALKQPFAVGNKDFTIRVRRPIRASGFMAVKRELVNRVGGFNPRYTRGQDLDWYERLIAAGGKSMFEPTIVSYYFPRTSFLKQFFYQLLNGFHRMCIFFETGRGLYFRHIIPVFLFIGLAVLSFGTKSPIPLVIAAVIYFFGILISSYRATLSNHLLLFLVAWAMILIHFGHILGILAGTVRFAFEFLLRKTVKLKGNQM